MKGLKVLRQIAGIDPVHERNLRVDALLIEYQDGTLWIDNDKPYDAGASNEIVKHTVGFIVTDEHYGKIAGPYRDLQKAESARSSAKVQVISVVETEPDEAEPDEPVLAAASAGGGARAKKS